LSTITAHPALHSLKKTCGAGTSFDAGFPSLGAAAAIRGAAFRALAGRRLDPVRDVREAVMNPIPNRTGEIYRQALSRDSLRLTALDNHL
jgi:hypothetical protein